MSKKLKKPSEYPQFSFRISEDDKLKLTVKLDEVLERLKENSKEGERIPKKNALILRAIRRGLSQIEKETSQK